MSTGVFYFAKPRTIPKIKWSHFHRIEDFGQAISTRLNQEILKSQVYLMGIRKDEDIQLWISALRPFGIDFFIIKPSSMDMPQNFEENILNNKKMVWVVPLEQMPDWEKKLRLQMKENFFIKALVFYISSFPHSPSEEVDFHLECNEKNRINCSVLEMARVNYRKALHVGQNVGMLNQIGVNEFLVLWRSQ